MASGSAGEAPPLPESGSRELAVKWLSLTEIVGL